MWFNPSDKMPTDNKLVEILGIGCFGKKALFDSSKDHWEDEMVNILPKIMLIHGG